MRTIEDPRTKYVHDLVHTLLRTATTRNQALQGDNYYGEITRAFTEPRGYQRKIELPSVDVRLTKSRKCRQFVTWHGLDR